MSSSPRDRRILVHIAANLRAERARAGLSQDELGYRAGLGGQQAVSRMENADGDGGITRYVRAAQALGIPVAALLDGVDALES
ncbi:MAG: hypothetical protein JWM98_2875 [Thermoleophilia bacterium]|nr:hypothetical protein [Thermoleophilia bacterium]